MKISGNSVSNNSQTGYEVQKSLLELLTQEDTLVKQLNTANHAYVVASKTATRLNDYKKNIEALHDKLEDTRRDMQVYLTDILGVSIRGIVSTDKKSEQSYVKREQMIESLYEQEVDNV